MTQTPIVGKLRSSAKLCYTNFQLFSRMFSNNVEVFGKNIFFFQAQTLTSGFKRSNSIES